MHPLDLSGPRFTPKSGNPPRQLVVILHGYGADGEDLIDLGRAWSETLPDAVFVAPNAPEPLPFEVLGGRQWFALQERDMHEYSLGSEAARALLDTFLDNELQRYGLSDNDMTLVGFSQGAMMALHTGLRRTAPPKGILAYSGLLPAPDQLQGVNTTTPVLMVHGAEDDVVPPYHLDAGAKALSNAGVAVEGHLLEGLGHSIDERAMVLGGRFLNRCFSAAG
ncbi:phospholipase/carboxylesterase family protein [Roseibium sp. TrichSKD4]|uniref:alpha/beta hydrolase n=1 Tax=Roseibium sp. TrichSKD4 TaxID=744980 RepID=UPI0001E56444|nr:alpha/beta hydrolase [Roseibium sp. TrichSKD4]EFO33104.1 phospholipase/carboxylesterase family protein [Roseibium sp. TrichSKD4]